MKKNLAVLIIFFVTGLVMVQNIRANGFKLLKFGDEILDVLLMSGKFTDEAVEVIRVTGKFTDEAVEVLRLSGRWSDDALEVLHIGGRYSDEVLDSLRIGSRYSERALDASHMSVRHGDKVFDEVSTVVSRGRRTWKRVYIDELGNVSDTSPQGITAFLEKYDQMIAKGATHADAKAAATIVQEQMDDICLNGYILNTVGN
jgi:hypothetical protein